MILLTFANLLLPVAILVFATGFFPYKTFIPGRASFGDGSKRGSAPFDKVILMVVDALRRFPAPLCQYERVLIIIAISSTPMAQVFDLPRGKCIALS